jgi:putative transposase
VHAPGPMPFWMPMSGRFTIAVAAVTGAQDCSGPSPPRPVGGGSERVRQSLRRQGLRPVYKRPYRVTTHSSHHLQVAPNILDRRFDDWLPNRAWVADLTYIATAQGWLYLAAIMDLASRRIVGWSMSERMIAGLVCQAIRSAYGQCRPHAGLILHSDQGSQYASRAYRSLAADFGMQVSMSRRANALDNAAMESFFKTLKVERIYQARQAGHRRLDRGVLQPTTPSLLHWLPHSSGG